jgi:hypothetical protein
MSNEAAQLAAIETLLDCDNIDRRNRAATARATEVYTLPKRVDVALQDLRRERHEHALTRRTLAATIAERDAARTSPVGERWANLHADVADLRRTVDALIAAAPRCLTTEDRNRWLIAAANANEVLERTAP